MKLKYICELISKIIWWILSLGTIVFTIVNNDVELIGRIIIIPIAILFCPIIQDLIFKKIGYEKEEKYFYYIKGLLILIGFIIAYIVSVFLFGIINNGTEKDLLSIYRISLYITYLLILFLFFEESKKNKYIIFGLFYFITILLGYADGNVQSVFIDILNLFVEAKLDDVAYNFFLYDCMHPIRESVLTYVLFDTVLVFGEVKDGMNEKENKNEKKNKIRVEGETILLENIVSDFEIETDKVKLDIKVKI